MELETLPITFAGAYFAPTVDGSINGNPTKALIDLSAYDTNVEIAALEAMGITYTNKFAGYGGGRMAYKVNLDSLKAGASNGNGWFNAFAYEDADFGFRIGADFLLKMDLEISLAQKYIKFWNPLDCGAKHLAYWDADAVIIPYTVHAEDDIRPLFKVRINGHEADAMFSPSTAQSVIDSDFAKKIGLVPDAPKTMAAGQPMKPWLAKIEQLEIGDEK
ncbi:hypothetical protein C7C56_018370 [Massilia glaciei]|uniref:Uncharacterized protein n=1 Tax=Massilia glaciei TaxID=1524097 RepID=A0A2U2HH67_9BURK|nr:hypothetical protein C7C56_018370 [Massilia glaciei]